MRRLRMVLGVALVVVLSSCTADSPAPTPQPTTDAPTVAPSETAAPSVVADDPAGYSSAMDHGAWEGVHFVSPSRNEGCAILGATAPEPELWGCVLAEQDWSVPRESAEDYCFESPVPCGYGVEVTGAEAPHPRRRGDPGFPAGVAIFEAADTGAVATLPYGHSVTYGDVTCVSAESGVTCEHVASRHGFSVSRAVYELH
jgi:hypothetical protein